MKSSSTVLVEAVIVGILLIVFTYIAQYIVKVLGWPTQNMPEVCASWNDTHVMEATLFMAGAIFHLVFEYTGLNEWYARNYVAAI